MNLLIVDDQKDVADSLKSDIDWKRLGITQTEVAYSVKQAKEVFVDTDIDIILTDIEMPKEDGLQLFKWVKEVMEDVVCIFLTSHADFEYAQRAIKLGGFDYILQPAKNAEIENVVKKACNHIEHLRKIKYLEKIRGAVSTHQSDLIDHAVRKYIQGQKAESIDTLIQFNIIKEIGNHFDIIYLAGIQVTSWLKERDQWSASLMCLVFQNILDELFEKLNCNIILGNVWGEKQEPGFMGLVFGCPIYLEEDKIKAVFQQFFHLISNNTDFEIALYTGRADDDRDTPQRLTQIKLDNIMKKSIYIDMADFVKRIHNLPQDLGEKWSYMLQQGDYATMEADVEHLLHSMQNEGLLDCCMMEKIHFLFWKALNVATESDVYSFMEQELGYKKFLENYHCYDTFMEGVHKCMHFLKNAKASQENSEDSIEKAVQYIKQNIHKNLTRREVSQYVFLHEDYFSRVFRQKTGRNFKDYVTEIKVEYACELLKTTNFTVSIIASKVGYDNFSYFAKVFKKVEGITPQEFRNQHRDK